MLRVVKSANDLNNFTNVNDAIKELHINEVNSEDTATGSSNNEGNRFRPHGQCKSYAQMVDILPSFNGIDPMQSVDEWINRIEEFGHMYDWDDITIRHYGLLKMVDVAKEWRDSVRNVNRSWAQWKTLLYEQFPVNQSILQKRRAAENFKRNQMEIQRYYYKKLALCNNANMSNEEIIELIVEGLGDNRFNNFLGPLRKYEAPAELLMDLREADRVVTAHRSNLGKLQQNVQYKTNKNKSYEWRNNSVNNNTNNNINNKSVVKDNKISSIPNGVTCFVCNERGHFARQCPNKTKKIEVLKTASHQQNNTHSKYIKTAFINNIPEPIQCFVDLGSSVTLIRESNAKQLHITYFENGFPPVTGYGGGKVVPIGIFTCMLKIDDVKAKCEVKVVPDDSQQFPILVGHQFTEQPQIKIVSDKRGLHISNVEDQNHLEEKEGKSEIRMVDDIVIPSNSIYHIAVQAGEAHTEWFIEGGIRDNGEAIPRCVVKSDENGHAMIPYVNLTQVDVRKCKNQRITRAEKCKEAEQQFSGNEKSEDGITDKIREEMIREVTTELVGKNLIKLYDLLYKYKDRITTELSNLGLTDKTELKVNLVDDIPVYYRPYRLAFTEREWVKNHVEELKAADIVEDSISDYASPILLVKKKSGEFRMCVDYRAINKKTIRQQFPIPLIDDQIDRLGGYEYFTSLDLANGYYQVPVESESRKKLAFITPDGHFQFKRMPFGPTNSPAVFQAFINKV